MPGRRTQKTHPGRYVWEEAYPENALPKAPGQSSTHRAARHAVTRHTAGSS